MKVLIAMALILITNCVPGQTIVSATSQDWAGGVCCISGTNYTVNLKFETDPETIDVREIYLQGTGNIGGEVSAITQTKDGFYCTIRFGTRHNETKSIPIDLETVVTKTFDGLAFLGFEIDGNPVELIVPKFEILMPLSYP